MTTYKVVEKFVSINGEGMNAGRLAVFIRLKGCNLSCSYCDTTWANEKDTSYEEMTKEEIYNYVKACNVCHVTITGGEPLIQPEIETLLSYLAQNNTWLIEVETNGSISIAPYQGLQVAFTLDYKLPESKMEEQMDISNYQYVRPKDTVKFVCSTLKDLMKARDIIEVYQLEEKCHVYLSPVFGEINPKEMVEYMMEHKMNRCNFQLQLHKQIWEPNQKGV